MFSVFASDEQAIDMSSVIAAMILVWLLILKAAQPIMKQSATFRSHIYAQSAFLVRIFKECHRQKKLNELYCMYIE